jgi:hypothetical protein
MNAPNPQTRPDPADYFDPRSIALAVRAMPPRMSRVFGDDFVRRHPGSSMAEVAASLGGGVGRPNFEALMTTDDFVHIIADFNRIMAVAAYRMNYPAILSLSYHEDFDDFRPKELVQGGMFPGLAEVPEGAEVTYGVMGEGAETIQAVMLSRLIESTTQALINDNLGLLAQDAWRIGESVADTKARILVAAIEGNPALSDEIAVFHASHGNLAAAGAVLSVDTLSAGRLAMQRQKDVDGIRDLGLRPAYLLVPPEQETKAEQLLTSINATQSENVNPFPGKLSLVVEHRLTDTKAWYLFARPEHRMGLQHGTVRSFEDPEIRAESPISRHAVITRVSTTFGGGWIDFRGAYKNAGPAG